MDLEHERRLTAVEQRAKSNSHRIEDVERITTEIHAISKSTIAMCEQMRTMNENVEELKGKVEALEQEPARRWKESTKAVFNAFLGALGTAVAGGLIYLLTMIK